MKRSAEQSGFIDEITLLIAPLIVVAILISIAFPWFSGTSPYNKALENEKNKAPQGENKAECLKPKDQCPGYYERW